MGAIPGGSRRGPARRGWCARPGLSLVELVVALSLFAGATLVLAAGNAAALRLLADARRERAAVAAGRSRLEAAVGALCPALQGERALPRLRIARDSILLRHRSGARVEPLVGAAPC